MKFIASQEDMQVYSAIVQKIAYLDYERNQLTIQLNEWEQAHKFEEEKDTCDQPQ